jgi:transposase InsO family protein
LAHSIEEKNKMDHESQKHSDPWGQFRFAVIGGLLACPPEPGELQQELGRLAKRTYRHPRTGSPVTFGFSTIERWYYQALRTEQPVMTLGRKIRSDAGSSKAMSKELVAELGRQYKIYPNWSYKLHADNLCALIKEQPELGDAPSYSTVARRMKERGWYKKRIAGTKGRIRAVKRQEKAEVRSFEASHVHALWHLDFHHGSLRVLDSNGRWHTPIALCILDDHSRLCCHLQWYLQETAEVLHHGLVQAFHKRGLPRSLMTDNGAAMLAGETQNGLAHLSVQHFKTLPYSPYQNGKQEAFWGVLEGRLLAMLKRNESLTLQALNQITQAWVEMEYQRTVHEETRQSPLNRAVVNTDVSRNSPESEEIDFGFTVREHRRQRQSDGTIQLKGIRLEIPAQFRHLSKITIRYRSWDMSKAWLVDQRNDHILAIIRPQDKTKNASGARRALNPDPLVAHEPESTTKLPPLLRKIMAEYAATGVPAAYIPMGE